MGEVLGGELRGLEAFEEVGGGEEGRREGEGR